jgi:hypothetical protein
MATEPFDRNRYRPGARRQIRPAFGLTGPPAKSFQSVRELAVTFLQQVQVAPAFVTRSRDASSR